MVRKDCLRMLKSFGEKLRQVRERGETDGSEKNKDLKGRIKRKKRKSRGKWKIKRKRKRERNC